MRPAFFVAFSGHRPSAIEGRRASELEECGLRLERLFRTLQQRVEDDGVNGEIHLVCSLAAGSDIIACEKAQKLGIPIHFILPKDEGAFLQTFYHKDPDKNLEDWISRAKALLATIRPDSEFTDIKVNLRNTMRIGAVSAISPECYAEVNTRFLETADLLVTMSNGQSSESIAGTTHLLDQARALDIPTINLDPALPPTTENPEVPDQFAHPDCDSLAPFFQHSPPVKCDFECSETPFKAVMECLAQAARRSAKWYRKASGLAVGCHALATVIAAIAAAFYYPLKKSYPEDAYLILAIIAGVELILVFAGWRLEKRLHHDNAQKNWLHCRFAREVMKSIAKANPFLDPLFPEIVRHQPEWRRFATTVGLALRVEKPIPYQPESEVVEDWRNTYLEDRINSQESFFRRSANKSQPFANGFRSLTHTAGFLALIFVLFAFAIKTIDAVNHYRIGEDHESLKLGGLWFTAFLLLLLPILLPLFASLGASFGAVFDYDRRSSRYHEIADNLALTAKKLSVLGTFNDISAEVRKTEETLMDELIEWYSAQKKGMGH